MRQRLIDALAELIEDAPARRRAALAAALEDYYRLYPRRALGYRAPLLRDLMRCIEEALDPESNRLAEVQEELDHTRDLARMMEPGWGTDHSGEGRR